MLASEHQVTPIESVQLGYMSLEDIHQIEVVQHWVQKRVERLANVEPDIYEIHIDDRTGCVTARYRMPRAKRYKIVHDHPNEVIR